MRIIAGVKTAKRIPLLLVKKLTIAVSIAHSGGRQVVAHASTAEGMRRAIMAGVSTIEHGDDGTAEVFKLMKEKNVALCPTLAAGDATTQYRGWKKGTEPEPERSNTKEELLNWRCRQVLPFVWVAMWVFLPMATMPAKWK